MASRCESTTHDLLDYFGSAEEDPTRRMTVLRGAGRAFCAGLYVIEKRPQRFGRA
jgi:enoyl-CoA hydratase/carnithine racemase